MSVGFDGVHFKVLSTDGTLPYPQPDAQGSLSYIADVVCDSKTHVEAIRGKQSILTQKYAIGMLGGGVSVVEAGIGAKTLVIPVTGTTEKSYSAVLVGVTVTSNLFNNAYWVLNLNFEIIAEL